MGTEIVKQSNALSTTEQQSSKVLAEMLMLCAQMQGRDLLPGEIRVWQREFTEVRPEKLEWCFRKHLTQSQFFPKPADITVLMGEYSQQFSPSNQYRRPDPKEVSALEAHKQTPEYKQAQKELEEAWVKMGGKI